MMPWAKLGLLWRRLTARSGPAKDMAEQMAMLCRLAVLVNSSLNPKEVLGFVAEATSCLLDGAAALVLMADEGGELTISASYGIARPELRSQNPFRPGEGLAGLVFETKAPLVLPDMLGDRRTLNRPWIEANGLRAFAGVPLLLRDECLGVVCAMRGGRPFGKLDVNLLEALAAHAVIAITHARLYERAEVEAERLRSLIEAMPEAVVVGEGEPGGKEMRLVMANRARAALLRTPLLTLEPRTQHYEYVRPDGTPLDGSELPLQRAIGRGEATRGMELAVRFPDGSQRHLLANAVPLPEATGRRQGIVVFQDITERKRLEQEAKIEAARLKAIMDTIPEPIVIVDAESGAVVQANRAALDLRGPGLIGSRPPYLGTRIFSAGGERELSPGEVPGQRACRGETLRGEQVVAELPDGRRVPYLVSAAPVHDREGRLRQAVVIAADIAAVKRAEEELDRVAAANAALYAQAARQAQVKGLLLEELHHRVRNILALIASFLELQKESPAGGQALSVLEDAIARVQGLAVVHNALAGEDFQAGEYAALARHLADQILLQGPLAGRVAVRVEDFELRLPSAQLTALGLITNELFTNIVKHAFPEGRSGTVGVSVQSADGWVTVHIRDDGVGLPPGFRKQPGHLGLELIHSLVEVTLKGTLALESSGGTTAVIRFPHPG
jgi:PAS domain S-box-containing protein